MPKNASKPAEKYIKNVPIMKTIACHFLPTNGSNTIIVAIVAGFKQSRKASPIIEKKLLIVIGNTSR